MIAREGLLVILKGLWQQRPSSSNGERMRVNQTTTALPVPWHEGRQDDGNAYPAVPRTGRHWAKNLVVITGWGRHSQTRQRRGPGASNAFSAPIAHTNVVMDRSAFHSYATQTHADVVLAVDPGTGGTTGTAACSDGRVDIHGEQQRRARSNDRGAGGDYPRRSTTDVGAHTVSVTVS